jgi:excisionase family DNA binding protein
MSDLPRMLSVADVAVVLGLSEYTVRQAVRDGDLPAAKLRGRIRIDPDAVRAWINASPVAPAPVPRPGLHAVASPVTAGVRAGSARAMIADARRKRAA